MIRSISRRLSVLLIVSLFLLLLVEPVGYAQDGPRGGLNIELSPTPLVVETKPGQSLTKEIKIKNAGTETERIKISLKKFGAAGEDGTPELLDIEDNDTFDEWVTFSENNFDIDPGVWKSVFMTILPPEEAAFGYYFAVIFSRADGAQQIQQGESNLLGAVADLVLLDVQAPGAKRETKLVEFNMPKKIYEFLPTDFSVRMQNTGNVHVAPRGNIFISRPGSSKNVALLEVNFNKGYILPNTFRKFDANWNDGSPVYRVKEKDGKVLLDAEGNQQRFLDWSNFNPSKIRFGRYTAKVVMVYNDGANDVPVEGVVSFWVIPWRIIGILTVALLLIGVGFWSSVVKPIRKGLKKKPQISKADESSEDS